jgi:hypothetical protein
MSSTSPSIVGRTVKVLPTLGAAVLPVVRKHARQELHELGRARLFAQVADCAAASSEIAELAFGEHRVQDERGLVPRPVPEHHFRQLVAAQAWHVDIEHDDVGPLAEDHGATCRSTRSAS